MGVIFAGLLLGIFFYEDREHQSERRAALTALSEAKSAIEARVLAQSQLIRGMAAAIAVNPDITQQEFADFAAQLLSFPNDIRNIGAAPDLIISRIYPLSGNEAALGLDYNQNEVQKAAALKARDEKEILIAGPINLVQGGVGLIARAPVFIPSKHGEEPSFWGLISAVIDSNKLFAEAGIEKPLDGYRYAIRGKDSKGIDGDVFIGSQSVFAGNPELISINLPFGNWILAAQPNSGWGTETRSLVLSIILALVASLLGTIPIFVIRWLWITGEERSQKLDEIIWGTNVGTWEWNVQTGETSFNERWAEIIGYSLNELTPTTIETWKKLTHPEDLKKSDELLDKNFSKEESYYQCEARMRHKNGYWVWVRDRGKVVEWSEDDEPLRMSGTRWEISGKKNAEIKLRESEATLRAVSDNIPICLNLKDIEGRYLYVNKPYEEWFGHSAEEIIGKKASEFLEGAEEIDNLSIAEKRMLETGKPHEGEIRVVRPSGEVFDRILIKFPIKGEDDSIIGLGTAAFDITERKKVEAELLRAKNEAEIANKSKSEFLASMSHEIRTPMTGISGFADLLLNDNLPPTSREKVEKIKSSTASLLTIINDILDVSKLDAGKLEIEKVNFDPSKIANDVVQLFHQTCPPTKKNRLTITSKITPDFPAGVCADPSRLRQVLINLIGNAVKFTDEGSVTLYCERKENENILKFRIVDTGIGIDQTTQEKLFGDFVQADASISRRYEGTGLGLSICKRLVELMRGEIGIESLPGEGSTFWFTLPYDVVPEGVKIIDQQALKNRKFQSARHLSLLVAEDNDINQTIIKAILDRMGHNCTFANNGAEAVEAVKAGDFDLILMDVRMPELSGPDATKQIRSLSGFKGQIPIIALTADVMAENQKSYFDAGMNDCVGKPINQEELAVAMNKAMGETVNMIIEEESDPVKISFNLDKVKSRLGLPEDVIISLLKKFAADYEDVAERILRMANDNDFDAVRELAHALKGVAGSLGMSEIAEQASQIEQGANANKSGLVQDKISKLATATREAVTAIEAQTENA